MPKAMNLFPDQNSPELVPVFAPDPAPQPGAVAEGLPVEILPDILLGEVIDISDLIPQLGYSLAGTPALPLAGLLDAAASSSTAADISFEADHAAALTILYDDDILASGGTIL
jgi:hypothetical protein